VHLNYFESEKNVPGGNTREIMTQSGASRFLNTLEGKFYVGENTIKVVEYFVELFHVGIE
jgi:hypothetical protein